MRTNVVFHGDVAFIGSNKSVCNRNPFIFTTYLGFHYEETRTKADEHIMKEEIENAYIIACVDDYS